MHTRSNEISARRVISEREAAELLGLSAVHVRRLRCEGRGPSFVRLGVRRVGYRLRDLDAWLEAQLSRQR